MTNNNKTGMDLLQDVLDAYGGDRTRWPAHVRLELSQLLTVSAEARQQLAEAQALDRLLDLAPAVPKARIDALAERIMAQAVTSPRVVAIGRKPASRPVTSHWGRLGGGIAALAASLVMGIAVGQSSAIAPTVSEIADAAGLSSSADTQQFAQFDDADVAVYEDTL
ncbi:MAG: hypothetical protein KDJ17_04730 [Hyphomicrobiaceae bacterium]|nr:hypothetical protein [Hyphomicrobiaceae bacterium]